MRSARYASLFVFLFLAVPSWGKQAPQQAFAPQPIRDPQAVAALQQAVAAMGAAIPSDSVATGTVTIVAGTETDQGTIRILTRGTNQTLEEEEIDTPQAVRTQVFSQGEASETVGTTAAPFPLQRAVTSHCPDFPLPYLTAILTNPDEELKVIGPEQMDGAAALHVEAINTFASNIKLQFLSGFTTTGIWLDAKTGLPLKISYVRRDTSQSPQIRMEVLFSDYRNIGGVLYPTSIQRFLNGTLWMTVTLQTVNFSTGLIDGDFPVVEVR